jgi:hypothetical protein
VVGWDTSWKYTQVHICTPVNSLLLTLVYHSAFLQDGTGVQEGYIHNTQETLTFAKSVCSRSVIPVMKNLLKVTGPQTVNMPAATLRCCSACVHCRDPRQYYVDFPSHIGPWRMVAWKDALGETLAPMTSENVSHRGQGQGYLCVRGEAAETSSLMRTRAGWRTQAAFTIAQSALITANCQSRTAASGVRYQTHKKFNF